MAALVPHLRLIELPRETVLFEAGDTIKTLYFPHNGIVSIVALSSGKTIETAAQFDCHIDGEAVSQHHRLSTAVVAGAAIRSCNSRRPR
jgi:CRP-like cAMP-binding protein